MTENDFTDALKTKLDGIATSANNYSLPDATASALGGIKVGTNLSIDGDGVLSSTNTTYSVGDGGLTENDFTDALKTKLDGAVLITTNQTVAGEKTFTSTITGISIDGSGDLTMGTVTMTGFSVDADGDVVAKSLDTKDLSANGKVITPSGTTGNQTINSMAGSVNFGSSDTSVRVTNSYVDENSVILLTKGSQGTSGGTPERKLWAVPNSSGYFDINVDFNYGNETKMFFLVFCVFRIFRQLSG